MSNIEKIKAEIERLKVDYLYRGYTFVPTAMQQLLNFIDSLPEEKPSDELEEAAWDCVLDSIDVNNPVLLPKYKELLLYLFIAGAEWQKKQQQLTWKDIDMILKISANMLDDRENSPIGLEKEWCQQVLRIFNLKKHE